MYDLEMFDLLDFVIIVMFFFEGGGCFYMVNILFMLLNFLFIIFLGVCVKLK